MITIIGAGIGGLTTALVLDKYGIDYEIYERTNEIKEVSAGIWVPPNALQVLKWIDKSLFNDIIHSGNVLDSIAVTDGQLNTISYADQAFVKENIGFTTTTIHRGVLQKILLERLNKSVHLSKSFKNFKVFDKEIEVAFNDQTKIITNSLIAADGIHSAIRNQLFPDSELRYAGQTCWRGISTYSLEEKYQHMGFTLWSNQLQFGISKISKDKVYWFATQPCDPNGSDGKLGLHKKLNKIFKGFDPLVSDLIQNTPTHQIYRSDLNDLKPLKNWHQDNICLIGDAAHAMTPDLGQGGAQAIEDAYYLGYYLNKYPTPKKAFEMFFQQRVKKVNRLVSQSRNTSKITVMKYGTGIRNFILKHMPASILEEKMLDTYRVNTIG